jgi:IS1 family transposase
VRWMKFGSLFKKNKNLQVNDPEEHGDCWTYTSFKRDSGLFIAFQAGKRIESTCLDMLDLFFDRMNLPTPDEKISIFTDGNLQYTVCLPDLYCEPCMNYGKVVKVKEKNVLVCVIREKIFGDPDVSSISTSNVEGYNNKIRQRLSRFGRKTASFSKNIFGYIASLNIFQFVHNFIEIKNERQSPAMMESVTDHLWNWSEFLCHHVQL